MRRAYPILHILLIAAMLVAAVAMANGGDVEGSHMLTMNSVRAM
ncbi:MAG: hypothetical protein AAF646_11930 [Pseudomonadota bacterium]